MVSLKMKSYIGIFIVLGLGSLLQSQSLGWRWECHESLCNKMPMTKDDVDTALSLPACRMFCNPHANLWPRPTGKVSLGNFLLHVNYNSIDVLAEPSDTPAAQLIREAAKRFKDHVHSVIPKKANIKPGGRTLMVTVIMDNPQDLDLTLETSEKYSLTMNESNDGRLLATIRAPNFFGARHGLETLSQLFIFDDIREELQAVRDVQIEDEPVYPYRGFLLDTSRNYVSVESIKRTIDGLAMNKMNTFHWHMTDSQSFPFVAPSRPEMSKFGAYNRYKVYTPEDIKDVIQYAKIRGVRVLPEFDAPAHVGEGWQGTDYVACFKAEPWFETCVEPPCGQLDPTKEGVYDVLEDLYGDIVDLFNPDIFHMGGDEVSTTCWARTNNIVQWMNEKGWPQTEAGFMKLWDHFQSKALERYNKKSKRKDTPIIMWTSTLTKTEYVEEYLPKDKYIIQIWTTGQDKQIKDLLERDYRLILSNYDALYLDCGFGAWVGSGNNWCSPYIGWQKVYDNSPALVAGNRTKQMLGAEAALWTEQADDQSLDNRVWPRTAAMAERLWAEPSTTWKAAEHRMLIQRDRMVERSIAADTLEPQWCLQNQGYCYKD